MPRKLAPLSVPYRVVQRGGSILLAVAFAVLSGGGTIFGGLLGPVLAVGLLGTAVLGLVAYEVAYYRRYEYELTADTFDIRSGVFARRNREIPLRRIQNVDIRRNVVQRVLGLAAVDFETAGGSETEAAIRFVTFEEAKRLQREIARSKRETAGRDVSEPAVEQLFAITDAELALLGALSFDFRVPSVLFLLVSGSGPLVASFVPDGGGIVVAIGVVAALALAVVLFSWVAGATVALLNYYGFRLTRAGDELQYERGLLQRYDGSIPLDKVQTLTIEDNPLKRHFGYATLAIETAGYAPGQGTERGSEAAIPLARRDRVFALANAVESFGDPAFERPPKRVRRRYAARYLIALAVVIGVFALADATLGRSIPWYLPTVLLPVIPVAAHYKWKHRGYWLGDDHVVTRNGVLNRETKVVPYYRIQTVIDTRTIFQRRWGLATVTIDTAGSLSLSDKDAAAVDVDAAAADRLRDELNERLRSSLATRRRTAASTSRFDETAFGDPTETAPVGGADRFEWVATPETDDAGDDGAATVGSDDRRDGDTVESDANERRDGEKTDDAQGRRDGRDRTGEDCDGGARGR